MSSRSFIRWTWSQRHEKLDPPARVRLAPAALVLLQPQNPLSPDSLPTRNASSLTVHPGPADLPPCPEFLSAEDFRGDDRTGSVVLFSRSPVAQILEFYSNDLSSDGWTLGSSLQQGADHHLQFIHGSRIVRIQLSPSSGPGSSRVFLAWSQPDNTPEAADSFAPDFEDEEPDDSARGSLEW